jgi:hypothetical protein
MGVHGFLKRRRRGYNIPVIFLNRFHGHPSPQGFNGIDNGLCA